MEQVLYDKREVCEILGISDYTLDTWYLWETKEIRNKAVEQNYLPIPIKDRSKKGCPRRWTEEMVIELKDYQKGIVRGRNGKYGKYSNPAWH